MIVFDLSIPNTYLPFSSTSSDLDHTVDPSCLPPDHRLALSLVPLDGPPLLVNNAVSCETRELNFLSALHFTEPPYALPLLDCPRQFLHFLLFRTMISLTSRIREGLSPYPGKLPCSRFPLSSVLLLQLSLWPVTGRDLSRLFSVSVFPLVRHLGCSGTLMTESGFPSRDHGLDHRMIPLLLLLNCL